MLLPQTGREELDVKGGMGINPLQDSDQVDRGIDVLYPARGEQALDDADGLAYPLARLAGPPVVDRWGLSGS